MVLAIVIDAPWLITNMYVIKDPFYHRSSDDTHHFYTSGGKSRIWAAIPVYIAIAYLILNASSATEAFYTGMASYAIYDFTVLAFRPELRLTTAIMDSLWGGFLFWATWHAVKLITK